MSVLVKALGEVRESDLWDLISNECTCTMYNIETDEEQKADECWGDCQQWRIDDFVELAQKYFRPGVYKKNWPTWRGPVPVEFELREVKDLLRVLPPRHGDYTMQYRLVKEPGRGNRRVWIVVRLAHHDGSGWFWF
jgi:hypothetical protein